MSAYDPKRTSGTLSQCRFEPVRCLVLNVGGGNEAARVHQPCRRRGGNVAVFSARTASGDAGDRVHERTITRYIRLSRSGIPPGPERNWLHPGPERGDRISLGAWSN